MNKFNENKILLYPNRNRIHNNIYDYSYAFSFFTLDNSTEFFTEKENTNHVLFILSGEIKLFTTNLETKIFKKDMMFIASDKNSAFKGIVLEKTEIVILNIGNSIPFYNDYPLKEIKSYCLKNIFEFEAIEIRQPIHCFLQGIILYFKYKIHNKYMYDLKKYEFLLLMQSFYDKEETIHFFSPIINNMSEFKNMVYSRYTNTCSVEQLASMCNMTTKTFTRRFKEQFNTTPYKWLMQQRNKSISIYLAQGVPIQKIADEFGFASTTSFISYCKKNLY
nr:helix-turn-helix domain-containing protein [uncultured Bacteroides sp.]